MHLNTVRLNGGSSKAEGSSIQVTCQSTSRSQGRQSINQTGSPFVWFWFSCHLLNRIRVRLSKGTANLHFPYLEVVWVIETLCYSSIELGTQSPACHGFHFSGFHYWSISTIYVPCSVSSGDPQNWVFFVAFWGYIVITLHSFDQFWQNLSEDSKAVFPRLRTFEFFPSTEPRIRARLSFRASKSRFPLELRWVWVKKNRSALKYS